MNDLFWLTKLEMRRIKPFCQISHGGESLQIGSFRFAQFVV